MLRCLAVVGLSALTLAAQDRLSTLRPSHPRIMATAADFERVRELVATDQTAKRLYGYLKSDADNLVRQTTTVRYILVGPRMLEQSRLALSRVYRLAFVFQIERDRQYLDRALMELWAAANFPDWNPSHFLDTAEMTHAFAIGYSWLYNDLSEEQREWLRAAIVSKGLEPALTRYRLNGRGDGWWAASPFNWNLVCNGGILAGALAIAEHQPEMARDVLDYAVKTAPVAMKSYAPEGGWAEGPGYWDYATRYAVVLIETLNTALGQDFDLYESEGFDKAGYFRIFTVSPIGRTFNYADSSDAVGGWSWALTWIARRFNQPTGAWFQLDKLTASSRVDPLDLIFFPSSTALPEILPSYAFKGVEVAVLRTSWTDRDGVFIGIKGGDNAANHSHLDLGSFVLDMKGQRWARDLGPDNYDLPDYFGRLRWTYYRLRTESHNTVLVDDANQATNAKAPIVGGAISQDSSWVTIDLTEAYSVMENWRRTAFVEEGKRSVLIDELVAKREVEMLWGMVTDAAVELRGRTAVLTKGGRTLTATLRSPEGAYFDTVSTTPASSAENQNAGTRKLVVRLPARQASARIEVAFE